MKVSILGSYINVLPSYEETFRQLKDYLRTENPPAYVTVNNVHTVVEGVLRPDYREITNRALLALPDGKPLSVVAKWKGVKEIGRVFGPTFFEKTLEWGQEEGLKHFLFGGSEETLARLREEIPRRFPRAQVAGAVSPPFRPLTEEENAAFVRQMNASGADIVWVAFGAPRQERWMFANYRRLRRGVMIGIGAGFDYLAGNTRHAPQWMKNASLEWLYRLIQEPGRLWKRYLVTNTLFIIYIALEMLGIKRFEEK
ncbi:MAG: WecB/TagA/CpsF family glycosyltransferase [Calditrichaceae bacterium]|nr:WecB/TagA/CpsF family glycosyltransferase [Calditrichia bacterium]NUQ44363.1 WecB/TagA/CpsF family glycosyltransferase [Calditrichaceae bacterium]